MKCRRTYVMIMLILGTLVGSLTSPGKFMAGASAGVYALIG